MRIVDITPAGMGALCDPDPRGSGADVINVEPPLGDPVRKQHTAGTPRRHEPVFLLKLAAGADVLVYQCGRW